MRPLWRNTLWLGFAAACALAGAWFGFDYGGGKVAEATWNISFANRVSDDFADARMALVALADRSNGNPAYAQGNLRMALADIGRHHQDWMSCLANDVQTLAAAKRYVDLHPALLKPEPAARKALALCPSAANAPVPPIATGSYRFELRDPEFPDQAPIETRGTVVLDEVVFTTVGNSSRFPPGTRFEGKLAWNAANGKWVLASSPGDGSAKDVGGCSDGPEVVDLEHFVFWVC
jgi:hypothetical protein